MTPEPLDLDAVEALCDAATAGPWRTEDAIGAPFNIESENGLGVAIAHQQVSISHDLKQQHRRANAAFIAAARTLVPALVTRLRALDAENARLRRRADRYREEWQKRGDEITKLADAARTAGA